MSALSRRQFLLIAALLGGVRAVFAQEGPRGGDNGIGGTGYRPGDNGIGGTGFIGTIRKFGSIYVNGQRIVYPSDAAVEIDGTRVAASEMRIGQVARLVADRRDETWTTGRIVIVSEVIGPVERIAGRNLVVLGQRVQLHDAKIARALKVGDRLAVSGLRRPDQTIVASAVVRTTGESAQVAGVMSRDGDGALRIGGQKVAGVNDALIGSRILVRGTVESGMLVAQETQRDAEIGIAGVRNVSIETWVSRRSGGLETAAGVSVEDRAGGVPKGDHLFVISGEIGADGSLIARSMDAVNRRGDFDPPLGSGGPNGGSGGGSHGGPAGGRGGEPHGRGGGHSGGFDGGGRPGGGGNPNAGGGLFGGGSGRFPDNLGGGPPGGGSGGGYLGGPGYLGNLPVGGAGPGGVFGGGSGIPGGGLPGGGFSAAPFGGGMPGGFAPGGAPAGGVGGMAVPGGVPIPGGAPGGIGGMPGRLR